MIKYYSQLIATALLVSFCITSAKAQKRVWQPLNFTTPGQTIEWPEPLYGNNSVYRFQVNPAKFNYTYKIKNGTVVPGPTLGSFLAYSKAPGKGTLEIYLKGKLQYTLKYTVVAPPPPALELRALGQKLDLSKPVSQTKFEVKIQPDPDFKKKCPLDALYNRPDVSISQWRGKSLVKKKRLRIYKVLDLTQRGFQPKSKDKFVIKVIFLEQFNSRGQSTFVKPKNSPLSFHIK